MVSPLAAPRWVGGSGARAEGPFAPGGQWITLPVIRSDRVVLHIRWYRERDPENGHPDRRPSYPEEPASELNESVRDDHRPGLRIKSAMTDGNSRLHRD